MSENNKILEIDPKDSPIMQYVKAHSISIEEIKKSHICDYCDYFRPSDEYLNYGLCANEDKLLYWNGGKWKGEEESLPFTEKADELIYTDSEGYYANFLVGKNFSCIHWNILRFEQYKEILNDKLIKVDVYSFMCPECNKLVAYNSAYEEWKMCAGCYLTDQHKGNENTEK